MLGARLVAGTCALAVVALCSGARAASYEFVPINPNAWPFPFAKISSAALNGDGTVAFVATPDYILALARVYRGDGSAPLETVYAPPLPGIGYGAEVWSGAGIDDAGRVYFGVFSHFQGSASSTILVQPGSTLQSRDDGTLRLGEVGPDGTYVFSVRDSGTADPGDDVDVVYRAREGEPEVEIARVAPNAALGPLAFDGNATVAFRTQDAPDSFRIQAGDGAAFYTTAWQIGPFACGAPDGCFSRQVSVDPIGGVAFRARFDGGAEAGIFTRVGQSPAIGTWVDTRGPFADVAPPPSGGGPLWGGGGRIAFLGSLDADPSRYGIYVGPDPVADRVIEEGEPLLGSVVAELQLHDFDPAGRIAFVALLEDGQRLLVRADPVPEPGPAAGTLAALAALLAGRRIWR